MTERFKVESYTDGGSFGWRLIDTKTGEEVGRDGGEPEDQLLLRDWKWVPELLNKLAAELDQAQANRDDLFKQLNGTDSFNAGANGYIAMYEDIFKEIQKILPQEFFKDGHPLDMCIRALIEGYSALKAESAKPIPMFLTCPGCNARHIDEGEFATKPHHTHACQACGLTWRPAVVNTVGVKFLPGFKNADGDRRPDELVASLAASSDQKSIEEIERESREAEAAILAEEMKPTECRVFHFGDEKKPCR